MTGELPSLDFSQSVNTANAEKNRYDDKIPCEFTCTKSIKKTVSHSVQFIFAGIPLFIFAGAAIVLLIYILVNL